jgi:Tat protein translocase TatB subunit
MFNLGFGELAVIFIVLIIAVGPDRLPTMMKGLGKTIRTVRQASRDIRATVGIDELMREDIMQPLPRRPVPKAAIARPPASTASLPAPAAADTPLAENARPADGTVAAPAVAPIVQPAAEAAPATAVAPVPPAAAAPPAPAAPPANPDEPAPRKD